MGKTTKIIRYCSQIQWRFVQRNLHLIGFKLCFWFSGSNRTISNELGSCFHVRVHHLIPYSTLTNECHRKAPPATASIYIHFSHLENRERLSCSLRSH